MSDERDKARTIDVQNAPRGTRVRTDPQSTADVDHDDACKVDPDRP